MTATVVTTVDWTCLTRMPTKIELYDRDVYFREGLRDAMRAWGSNWKEILHQSAFLMLKPDGLAAGVAETVCAFLEREGFSICAVHRASLSDHVWRALWRFQLTAASTDRLLINELKYRHPAVVLLLRLGREVSVPAAVHLARLKGLSDPARQDPTKLRWLLKQPHRFFTFVHIPDEPADLLREVGILGASGGRGEILQSWRQTQMRPDERDLLDDVLRSASTKRVFELASALARVGQNVRQAALSGEIAARLRHDLSEIAAGRAIDWQTFASLVTTHVETVDLWDLAAVGAFTLKMDDPGGVKAIGTPDYALWETQSC